jgi:predicted esterase
MKINPRTLLTLTLVVVAMATSTSLRGQGSRYELGQRLRDFEGLFEKITDPVARGRSLPAMESAVTAFFSLRMGRVAESLDAARFALLSDRAPEDAERFIASLSLRAMPVLRDPSDGAVVLSLRQMYKPAAKIPAELSIKLQLEGEDPLVLPLERVPAELRLAIRRGLIGDRWLTAEFQVEEKAIRSTRQLLSFVPRFTERLEALKAAADNKASAVHPHDHATLRARVADLTTLAGAMGMETDLPGSQWMAFAEELVAARASDKPRISNALRGEQWLALAIPGRITAVPVRIWLPPLRDEDASKKIPVVVALHGAGGSENMFFDGYGVGKARLLCESRGFALISPRGGMMGSPPVVDLVDALSKVYPLDRERFHLVGHSMGAGNALQVARESPERLRSLALISAGAGRAHPSLTRLPIFLATADRDFSRGSTKRLADVLMAGEEHRVTFREYPLAEHLLVVQVALPDVFQFFDVHQADSER